MAISLVNPFLFSILEKIYPLISEPWSRMQKFVHSIIMDFWLGSMFLSCIIISDFERVWFDYVSFTWLETVCKVSKIYKTK